MLKGKVVQNELQLVQFAMRKLLGGPHDRRINEPSWSDVQNDKKAALHAGLAIMSSRYSLKLSSVFPTYKLCTFNIIFPSYWFFYFILYFILFFILFYFLFFLYFNFFIYYYF
jgi:hypothetical protein